MDLGLREIIVLVTGGAKGIGAATLKTFLAEDCKVVIVDRDAEVSTVQNFFKRFCQLLQ